MVIFSAKEEAPTAELGAERRGREHGASRRGVSDRVFQENGQLVWAADHGKQLDALGLSEQAGVVELPEQAARRGR